MFFLNSPVTLLAAAIASMAMAYLWYSPMMFGKRWMELMGPSGEKMSTMNKSDMTTGYLANFMFTIIMAFMLSYFIKATGAEGPGGAITVALWIWLGFIMTVQASALFWEKKPFDLFIINSGSQFVSLLVMSVIMGTFM